MQQEADHGIRIHFGSRGHPLVGLSFEHLDSRVRKHGRESVGDVEIPRAFGADLQEHGNVEAREATRVEIVANERAEVSERGLRVRDDRTR